MKILGIHYGHDANVALIEDGKILFAIGEERLSRKKFHRGFPFLAIEHTLNLSIDSQTSDGRYGFQLGQCNGTCSQAPQIWVDGQVCGKLSISDAIRIARDIRGDSNK